MARYQWQILDDFLQLQINAIIYEQKLTDKETDKVEYMRKIHTTGRPFCLLADASKFMLYKAHSFHYDFTTLNTTTKHTAKKLNSRMSTLKVVKSLRNIDQKMIDKLLMKRKTQKN